MRSVPIPCPFCGCEEIACSGDGKSGVGIFCTACNATLLGFDDKRTALQSWNKRVNYPSGCKIDIEQINDAEWF